MMAARDRDRAGERAASRQLRRSDTTVSMLRMLYGLGALPALMLVYFHGLAVMHGAVGLQRLFTLGVSLVLLAAHVAGIALIRRVPLVVSIVMTCLQSAAWIFYMLFAPSAFSLVAPPILAFLYACGIIPMISVHSLKRDYPDLWASRRMGS